jgi:UDPglucose 6-dehydrogenase
VDAIVVVTEWREFGLLDWAQVASVATGRIVVDGRNFIDRSAVAAAGLTYEGIGR